MAQGLSEQSNAQWGAFVQSAGGDASGPLDRELLNEFVIGVHRRGDELSAHELKTLVEELGVEAEMALEIMAFIESGLALLEAYDRSAVATDDEDGYDYPEGARVGEDDVGPGILVM